MVTNRISTHASCRLSFHTFQREKVFFLDLDTVLCLLVIMVHLGSDIKFMSVLGNPTQRSEADVKYGRKNSIFEKQEKDSFKKGPTGRYLRSKMFGKFYTCLSPKVRLCFSLNLDWRRIDFFACFLSNSHIWTFFVYKTNGYMLEEKFWNSMRWAQTLCFDTSFNLHKGLSLERNLDVDLDKFCTWVFILYASEKLVQQRSSTLVSRNTRTL